ncbi:uncharacterized protein BYT42DRAFT_495138, partial [Radiomyces spectabilis]|uniref:uncharacterized protein n=1 Tax=Radiomyces spectabilis TaxID=64574 RepID=UPI00221F2A80
SVAFFHFSTNTTASVFYNTYHSTGLISTEVFEEGLHLLEEDRVKNQARLDELESQLQQIMEERRNLVEELEDFEKKKSLAEQLVS